MTEIHGFIAVSPTGKHICNVSYSKEGAWAIVMLPSRNRSQLERDGWRVVPCKLVIEDGK